MLKYSSELEACQVPRYEDHPGNCYKSLTFFPPIL
jgi:hypothetical protein